VTSWSRLNRARRRGSSGTTAIAPAPMAQEQRIACRTRVGGRSRAR
jgi:hypothetical protein